MGEPLTNEQKIDQLKNELMELEDYLYESKCNFREGNVTFDEVMDDIINNVFRIRHNILEAEPDSELTKLIQFINSHLNEIIGVFFDHYSSAELGIDDAMIHTTHEVLSRWGVKINYDNITSKDQVEAVQPLIIKMKTATGRLVNNVS